MNLYASGIHGDVLKLYEKIWDTKPGCQDDVFLGAGRRTRWGQLTWHCQEAAVYSRKEFFREYWLAFHLTIYLKQPALEREEVYLAHHFGSWSPGLSGFIA